jgi:2Fe-2S ferredoxin
MPKIKFIEHNGTEHIATTAVNRSAMQVATDNMIPGIIADCGGNCACATCHVYVDESWATKLAPPAEQELAMIECALHVQSNSRLACQILITPELDGLVLRLPESQI